MIETLPVYPAELFTVTHGVAEGDALSFADELMMDDIYQLRHGAVRTQLLLERDQSGRSFTIAADSALGGIGRVVHLDSCITLIDPAGQTVEALIFVEVEAGAAEAIYLSPLAGLTAQTDYRLVGIDRHAATLRYAETASAAFGRGTQMTLADGRQQRIEDLRIGDRLLTRDDGPRPIRWIGQRTLRAVGETSPVVIRKGALHNENDLVLSPDNRIFVWQREDRIGAGRSEVMIKARALVDGAAVFRREGGFVDYYLLLFEDHQIIFAEGIAAESLLIDPRTGPALPPDVRDRLIGDAPGHGARRHSGYEVAESLTSAPGLVDLLRRATDG